MDTPASKKPISHAFKLNLQVPQAGHYVIFIEGRTGPDAGALQLLDGNERVGDVADFYAPTAGNSGPRKLGEKYLLAGHNLLCVAMTVRDPSRGGGVHVDSVTGQLTHSRFQAGRISRT